jgi:hypothetical protein
MLKAKGLFTFSNYLSNIPEGSLFEASNVIIDRDGIIEPRRGIKVFGNIPEVSKQLLTFKNRILTHYGDSLAFGSSGEPGTFTSYRTKKAFTTSDVDTATDTFTINQHELPNLYPIKFESTGTLPSPIVSGTTYYTVNVTENTFQISINPNGSPILDITTVGTGDLNIDYDFIFSDVSSDIRMKYIELNGNLYVTTNTGIKKLSDINQYSVSNAGGIAATELNLALDLTTINGFLEDGYEVGYRIVWGTKDINENLILGAPSYRSVIQNSTGQFRNISLEIAIPNGITTDYFYQVYRSSQAIIGASNDEMKLVYEAPYNNEVTISIIDQQPEDLRDTGTPLYTNQFSGEGIAQANYPPPVAKDVTIYKNTAFYANTRTPHRQEITLLGQDGLIELDVTGIDLNNPAEVTTSTAHNLTTGDFIAIVGTGNLDGSDGFDGNYQVTVTSATTFTIPADGATQGTLDPDVRNVYTSSVVVSKDTSSNRYYFVGRPEIYEIDVGTVGAALVGKYFTIYSANDKLYYYVWFDDGTAVDPGLTTAVSIQVPFLLTDTAAQVADNIKTALDATNDFICTVNSNIITIQASDSGPATNILNIDTPGDWVYTIIQNGFGEDINNNWIKLSSLVSPSLRIESTAKSLASVITRNPEDFINVFYISNINELPGALSLESRQIDEVAFSIQANSTTTGAMFSPDITNETFSTNEVFKNKLYFSKKDQPESVPKLNSLNIGPKDKAILRIIGLGDGVFILKEEGIYRLVGEDSTSFSVALFDNSANIIAPDTACVLNNQIYCLSTQGVITISETGVSIISRPIEDIVLKATSPAYTFYKTASFGVGYESDRAYILFLPDNPDDTIGTIAYRYNTFTQSWTSWDKSATCGVVEPFSNKLFLGASDINSVEVERKLLTSRDYADRQYDRQITLYNNNFIYVDSANIMEQGDSLTQTQYLTPGQYNRLVIKAKADPLLNLDNSFLEIDSPGTDLLIVFEDLVTELNSSDSSLITQAFSDVDVSTLSDDITIVSHGLEDDDTVKFTGASLPSPLLADTYYFVVNSTTNTFQVSNTLGGAPINFTTTGSGAMTVDELYYISGINTFDQIQADFNYNVQKLNMSTGVFFSDYQESTGTMDIDLFIKKVYKSANKVEFDTIPLFFLGDVIHYKAIKSSVVWAYMAFGEPSISKHIREGVILLESVALGKATIGYATDLSGNFEDIPFGLNGSGSWGNSIFSNVAWGGKGITIPLRTLIPRQKQRCRYISARFKHSMTFFKFSIMGISYTFEPVSERAYRL